MMPLISFLIALAILFISWGIAQHYARKEIRFKLPVGAARLKKKRTSLILQRIFPFSRKLIEKSELGIKIKNTLDAAHVKLSVQEFLNLKILLMLVLTLVAIFSFGKFNPAIVLVALAVGYILPDFYLQRRIRRRKQNIARVLPETVDLLGLCVEAGLDFTTAARWIIDKTTPTPMTEELSFVLEEIKWGKSRIQALRDMAKRLNIPEVSSFVQSLVLAERMGTPVSEAFAILSEDTRLQRFHRGERFAMQAPIKILIPLIFCILPVIAIIIGGPIFLQFMQGGLLKGLR
ncbi:MAG: type II secretion system F family protein [Candidatus Omnitrophica bacterium]|nr:type II secretion system F family protein [Candidatus Omnitrophota bacterium]